MRQVKATYVQDLPYTVEFLSIEDENFLVILQTAVNELNSIHGLHLNWQSKIKIEITPKEVV